MKRGRWLSGLDEEGIPFTGRKVGGKNRHIFVGEADEDGNKVTSLMKRDVCVLHYGYVYTTSEVAVQAGGQALKPTFPPRLRNIDHRIIEDWVWKGPQEGI